MPAHAVAGRLVGATCARRSSSMPATSRPSLRASRMRHRQALALQVGNRQQRAASVRLRARRRWRPASPATPASARRLGGSFGRRRGRSGPRLAPGRRRRRVAAPGAIVRRSRHRRAPASTSGLTTVTRAAAPTATKRQSFECVGLNMCGVLLRAGDRRVRVSNRKSRAGARPRTGAPRVDVASRRRTANRKGSLRRARGGAALLLRAGLTGRRGRPLLVQRLDAGAVRGGTASLTSASICSNWASSGSALDLGCSAFLSGLVPWTTFALLERGASARSARAGPGELFSSSLRAGLDDLLLQPCGAPPCCADFISVHRREHLVRWRRRGRGRVLSRAAASERRRAAA